MDTEELRGWARKARERAEWQRKYGFFSSAEAADIEALSAILTMLGGPDEPKTEKPVEEGKQ